MNRQEKNLDLRCKPKGNSLERNIQVTENGLEASEGEKKKKNKEDSETC